MRLRNSQGGFTIVEVGMVLAISAAMVATVLVGQGVIRKNAQFTTALDTVKNQLKYVQSDASQIVDGRNSSGSSSQIAFGKLVEFENTDANRQNMHSWTLIADEDKTTLRKCDHVVTPLQQQFEYRGSQAGATRQALIFTNHPEKTYVVDEFEDAWAFQDEGGGALDCDPDPAPADTIDPVTDVCDGYTRTQDNPLGNCVSTPVDLAGLCDVPGTWKCGIYGQYYGSATRDAATGAFTGSLRSAFVEDGVGAGLGGGESSYPNFMNTLRVRVENPVNDLAVHWTGQIKLKTGVQTICFDSDDGAELSIAAYRVGSLASPTPAPDPCLVVYSPAAAWQDINIRYSQQNGTGARAQLFEKMPDSSKREIPTNELRTSVNNQEIDRPINYVNGLYGEYFDGLNSNSKRVSAWTDPLIGNGGTRFSYGAADAFLAELGSRTNGSPIDKSVRWTGQILVDSANPVSYCMRHIGKTATLKIDGISLINLNSSPAQCSTPRSFSPGWHDIEATYSRTANECPGCTTPQWTAWTCYDGPFICSTTPKGNIVLDTTLTQEIPNDHFRRPMDWSVRGAAAACHPFQNSAYCGYRGDAIYNLGSSGGNCTTSNNAAKVKYTKTGLTPGSDYFLDLTYFNPLSPNLGSPPSSYKYEICLWVNGTLVKNNYKLPAGVAESRLTETFKNIDVPASGNMTIEVDWLNDEYNPFYMITRGYDANFAIERLDVYRGLPDTAPAAGPGNPNCQVVNGVASCVSKAEQPEIQNPTKFSLKRFLLGLVPEAYAATCNKNIYNIENYNDGCFGLASSVASMKFELPDSGVDGYIDVRPSDGSIERRVIN